ncbi:MAG TPA: DnaD domain protein [Bacillota bacterium]|nr:DnaD domain protein [Bacillota bacterium]HQD75990.1 DnaD domain protein [Bacillota bacterium]HUM58319.1 DnaD domain protein [Bacillota bacterium]
MAGWVKLWRKLKDNGHLKMPGTAFKLWIYCLLEATPYQDRARDLKAGELWLNYEHVRQVIGEAGRQMSKSTVSNALKYLEQNGYLELQAKQFYGVKARVANWQEYQSGTETVPVRVQKSYPASTETVLNEKPEKTRLDRKTSTENVPDGGLPGISPSTATSTKTVPVTVPVGVLVREPEPYSSKASSAPKNIENIKNKDLYIDPAAAAIASEFEREFGRPLSPIEINKLASWQKSFPDELIKEALARAALQDKRSIAYVGGILKSWWAAGITTVEDARREQVRPGAKGGKRNANIRAKPGYRPSEVDWSAEPDTL